MGFVKVADDVNYHECEHDRLMCSKCLKSLQENLEAKERSIENNRILQQGTIDDFTHKQHDLEKQGESLHTDLESALANVQQRDKDITQLQVDFETLKERADANYEAMNKSLDEANRLRKELLVAEKKVDELKLEYGQLKDVADTMQDQTSEEKLQEEK